MSKLKLEKAMLGPAVGHPSDLKAFVEEEEVSERYTMAPKKKAATKDKAEVANAATSDSTKLIPKAHSSKPSRDQVTPRSPEASPSNTPSKGPLKATPKATPRRTSNPSGMGRRTKKASRTIDTVRSSMEPRLSSEEKDDRVEDNGTPREKKPRSSGNAGKNTSKRRVEVLANKNEQRRAQQTGRKKPKNNPVNVFDFDGGHKSKEKGKDGAASKSTGKRITRSVDLTHGNRAAKRQQQ